MKRVDWNEEDKQKLLALVNQSMSTHEIINWKQIQTQFSNRTSSQIKSYFYKYMKTMVHRKRNHAWTFQETKTLLSARYVERMRVSDIAKTHFPAMGESVIRSKLQNMKKESEKLRTACQLIQSGVTSDVSRQWCVNYQQFVTELYQFLLQANNSVKDSRDAELLVAQYGDKSQLEQFLEFVKQISQM
uniref:Myb-like DNA-binding domain-containing protein n=1 Tax=Trepomonas sp. PC1 TaxID=1076344 RepID=A0A146K9S2_9EUKA|eukprot:JAP92241.1 Myb-like DNA-binding domain-containing protein [Trepomonas sp. PC1]